jgi:uncharacterized protein YjbJ (UPF0337 family)
MTTAVQSRGGGVVDRPSSASLGDVIDTILDKGLVIDAYVRVSLVGIELLTVDARIVVASVDTYLRFAEAVNRLDIAQEKAGLPELVGDMAEGGAQHKVKGGVRGALEAAGDKVRDVIDDPQERPRERRRHREED